MRALAAEMQAGGGAAAITAAASGTRAPVVGCATPPRKAPGSTLPHKRLEAARQPAAVRHGQPEAQQQPFLVAGAAVLIGRAAVENDVIVQELDVARDERRVEAHVLRDLGQQVQRLVLRRR